MRTPAYVFRILARWALLSGLLAVGLFVAAGTTHVTMLRAYIAVFSAMLLATMLAVNPELARERAHPGGDGRDSRTRFAAGFFFLVTVGAAAIDVGQLHQSDNVPRALSIAALVVFAASVALQAWAMVVNPFFSPAIRVQSERGHSLITRGPYRFLRHPGYLAMLFAMPASALAIGSWLALIPAAGFGVVIVARARMEDEFLSKHLAGYADYMQRVPVGLLPHLSPVRIALLAVAGFALLAVGLVYGDNGNSTAGVALSPSPFNEQRAFDELKLLTTIGPRPPGSVAHDGTTIYLFDALLAAGVGFDGVHLDTFQASTPIGQVEMTNVIAKIPGAEPEIVVLGGHYDTKRMKLRFVGANDGASSAAFLLEMARVLVQRQNRFTYWIVFFDGEEALKSWSASDSLYGSRHFVRKLTPDQVKHIRAMINVDMIGDRDLHIHRETHSDPQLTNLIFEEARDLGYGRYFLARPLPVGDDHMPFLQAGIPAVDLISLDFGPLNLYWHTPLDTAGECSPKSLGIVGRVLLAVLDDLEGGRTPTPALASLDRGAPETIRQEDRK